jgi:autotransporter adhesin
LSALLASQTGLQGRVDDLFDLRRLDRRDTRQGIAAAVAMGHAPMPSEPGRTSYVLNGSTFRGEYAIGGSIMHRLSGDTPFAIGAGFSFAGNKNNAVRVGVAGEF